jgi:hypothetical protein
VKKNKAFNPGTPIRPPGTQNMTMSFRQRRDGVWFLIWRVYSYSNRDAAMRRAHDTEVALIHRILELEAALADNGLAPPKLKPLVLQPYTGAKKLENLKNVYATPPKEPT